MSPGPAGTAGSVTATTGATVNAYTKKGDIAIDGIGTGAITYNEVYAGADVSMPRPFYEVTLPASGTNKNYAFNAGGIGADGIGTDRIAAGGIAAGKVGDGGLLADEIVAGQDARALQAIAAEARQVDGRRLAASIAGDRTIAESGGRRRTEDLPVGERGFAARGDGSSPADALIASPVSSATGSEATDAGAQRREGSADRRPALAAARLLNADAAGAGRAGDGSAAGSGPSTVSLASPDGAALRGITETERPRDFAQHPLRAPDAAVLAPMTPSPALAQPAGVPTVVIQPALTDPAFAQALGQQVGLLVGDEISLADMVVTPPEMGPVRVELTVRGDSADVVFTAAAPETLRAIEASGEVLRSMLAERGIALGSMDVGQGQAQSSSASLGDGASHRQHASDRATTADQSEQNAESTVRTASSAVHRRGLVDLLA